MNAAYISALSGLLGAAIGGLTSFFTTWITQHSQLMDKNRQLECDKREKLFGAFIEEASRLYGDALGHQKDDVADLVKLYALVGHMRLVASREVVMSAERTMDAVIQTYLSPNHTLHELREFAEQGGMNFLVEFGETCRSELVSLATQQRAKS